MIDSAELQIPPTSPLPLFLHLHPPNRRPRDIFLSIPSVHIHSVGPLSLWRGPAERERGQRARASADSSPDWKAERRVGMPPRSARTCSRLARVRPSPRPRSDQPRRSSSPALFPPDPHVLSSSALLVSARRHFISQLHLHCLA
jgi:hypothetical protein